MLFNDFNLDSRITSSLPEEFSVPTPIQASAIPPVMEGKDVLGLAQTGTGKTAAFVLPVLHKLLNNPSNQVSAVIIAPTRELVEQIQACVKQLSANTDLKSISVFGGVNINQQIRQLQRGVDIVVACPGRLLDLLNRKSINLSSVQVLILDEADQMFDMGFLPDIKRIVARLPKERQNLLFSATMPPEIKHLAMDLLTNPVTVKMQITEPLSTISHSLYPIQQEKKINLVMSLLKETEMESVLIFTRTKHRAKKLGNSLKDAGYKATSLQGNLSQGQRNEAMKGFRAGRYKILVATDIAARGIDVSSVSHVINFDMPNTVTAYTHRIGRTGRAARSGEAFTLATREDRVMIKAIEKNMGNTIDRREVEGVTESLSILQFENAPRRARGPRSSGGNQRGRGFEGRSAGGNVRSSSNSNRRPNRSFQRSGAARA